MKLKHFTTIILISIGIMVIFFLFDDSDHQTKRKEGDAVVINTTTPNTPLAPLSGGSGCGCASCIANNNTPLRTPPRKRGKVKKYTQIK